MIPPLPTTIVATVYTLILAILSCVQFRRSQTPLRLGAAVMGICGLSISALSIVYTTDKMSLSAFWVYQFVAECIAVTWVITTIIHLGYAFYPLTRHQTLIWRTALGSVVLYDLVAIAELSYYCYGVWGSGSLSAEVPELWIYWVRQMVKVLTCAITIAYLFVPLVRHHHSTGVAMIADSNTLAVGTWYLSALGVTFLGYTSMFIYYMNKPNDVFSPQAQALDLCIRLTACPIFSLPPPQFLLRYFHAKYGSTVRDDNPHTMIEEGITNDPRPRRPPMLVSQPTSYNSRREHDYDFDYPSIHERHSLRFQSPYSALDDDDRCRRYIEEETNIGTTSSLGTAADTSPKLNPHSAGSTLKQDDTHMPPSIGVADDAVLSALSITLPPTVHHPTPIKGESLSPISPFSFAPGVLLARGEEEETAIAARRISRRLTMEGRKDGLDFLNISGLMKWPHRPNSAIPATKSRVTGSTNSSSALPTTTSGTNFLKASRRHSDTPERNISPSRRAVREKLSMMGGSSLVEEDEAEEDQTWHSRENKDISEKEASHHEPPSRRGSRKDEKLTEPSNTTTTKSAEQYTSVEPSNIRTNVQQLKSHENGRDDLHAHLPAFNVAASEYNGGRGNNTSQSIGKKMSMDKIRRMSRSALTRLQEGGLGAALSIPTTTGPLSPTILHTEHGYPARGERMGPKSLPHAGGDVLISMPPDQQHNDESHGQQNGPIITP